jgi:hypothetical protein
VCALGTYCLRRFSSPSPGLDTFDFLDDVAPSSSVKLITFPASRDGRDLVVGLAFASSDLVDLLFATRLVVVLDLVFEALACACVFLSSCC